jgi:hypothetical protein
MHGGGVEDRTLCSIATSGNSARITRSLTVRQSREVSRTFDLSTWVILRRPVCASRPATRVMRSISPTE